MRNLRQLVENDTIQRLSGAGAVDPRARVCLVTSTGSAQALTLKDGKYDGQTIRIVHYVDGGSSVLTKGANVKLEASVTTITLTSVHEWVELMWSKPLGVWVVTAAEPLTIIA